ncbi:hypothetical protein [Demequina gelatinilytica]|uniref:hypothetical protein n=1 Tax=Demequina gelatinilytica TaxID=1638980 RepID=UPI00078074EA|nr:hypothetical protein [Demequina gelatinilytica]
MPTSENAPAGAPFTFASQLGLGLTLLIIGNAVVTLAALSGVGVLAIVGSIVGLVGLILTVSAVTRQAAAIEAIAAALNVSRPASTPTQVSNAEFFGKQ